MHSTSILRSNVDRKQAMELDRLVAKLPTCKLLTTEWDQLQDLITEHAASTSLALELMDFKLAEIAANLNSIS